MKGGKGMPCKNLDVEPCPLVGVFGDTTGLWPGNFQSARVVEVHYASRVGHEQTIVDLVAALVPRRQRKWRLDHIITAGETWADESSAAEKERDAIEARKRKRRGKGKT